MRVGLGVDVHAFAAPEEGRRLVLGGVEIPSDRGLLGHSDADVLAHAIMDALLGAAGLEDIGDYFPDTDERHREAMRKNLAAALGTQESRVGVRGTTTERLGFAGRGEGIAAQAVCLLERR